MKRYADIVQLLGEVDASILRINQAYETARKDDEIDEVLKPVIKSTLENLRSILDYSAHDIWDSYTRKNNSPHFPYGPDQKSFEKSVSKNLPGLNLQRPDVYALVESIQPFKCGAPWLPDLCSKTNFNKHRGLTKQSRKNSKRSTVTLGKGAVVSRDGGCIIMIDCVLDGVSVGREAPVIVNADMKSRQIRSELGEVPVLKEFEWVEFLFDGSIVDARSLIVNSRENIDSFIKELRRIV
ncbi:hypothetical protein D9M69_475270 [compost metagenome]